MNDSCIERLITKSRKYVIETIPNLGAKIWDILLENPKKLNLIRISKTK